MTATLDRAGGPETSGPRVRFDRGTWIGLALTAAAVVVYWLSNRFFDAQHADFFYLADAFLHGRTWFDPAAVPPGAIGG